MAALGFVAARAFLYLWRARTSLCCGARASHCSGFSCCGEQALGVQASALGSWGSAVAVPGLYTTGLVFVEHGLNCSSTCEIFWTRVKPVSPPLGGGFFTTEPPGKPPGLCFLNLFGRFKV